MQTRTNAIQQGWDVYGSDDQKIGSVDQVASNYLVIQKGWFFTSDVYVPTQAIESVDAGRGPRLPERRQRRCRRPGLDESARGGSVRVRSVPGMGGLGGPR